jgi:hypothetical protein
MEQPFDPTKLEERLVRLEYAVESLRLQVLTNNELIIQLRETIELFDQAERVAEQRILAVERAMMADRAEHEDF